MKRSDRKLHKVLLASMVMTLLLGLQALAAGTRTVTMRTVNGAYISSGKDANVKDYKKTVYHKLQVNKSGYLAVTGLSKNDSGTKRNMKVVLCNSKKQVVEVLSSGTSVDAEKTRIAQYGVAKGTYYLKVSGQKNYSLAAKLVGISDKSGSSKSKAAYVAQNAETKGLLAAGESASKADWYRFRVTKSKVLKLKLKAYGNGKMSFYVYGPSYPNGCLLKSFINGDATLRSARGDRALKVRTGTYYIKVVRRSGNAYKKSSGMYSLKWQLV